MIHILHNRYDIDADWIKPALSEYIKPDMRVCVVAFSFRSERVSCAEEWSALYAPGSVYYEGIRKAFAAYGIGEGQIDYLNYFADTKKSAREKVSRADILFFLGGLPDKMYERLMEFDLRDALLSHDGIVMGYSAGALIQMKEYHLSPDRDYPQFGYYEGLGYLDGFYAEVHYENAAVQNEAIQRVLHERRKPVYGLPDNGAIIAADGNIKTVGPVQEFLPREEMTP